MITVEWVDGKVRFLDQTLLPFEERYCETDDARVVGDAIRVLQIRGAPAIGVAAAFGVLLAFSPHSPLHLAELKSRALTVIDLLGRTRPTAVNLFAALNRMNVVLETSGAGDGKVLWEDLHREAQAIYQEDVEACRRIGEHGAALLTPCSSVLTHCNAGALATAGQGTALGVITTAARQGKIVRVFVDETRPLLQGARLTSWELLRAGIRVVLITDSTAATVMQRGEIQAVIVGADRIASNGDVANKIGTYPLAVLAHRHHIPFYVAAPLSTLDMETPTGGSIVIEERDPTEVTHCGGRRIAAQGVEVFAPAFDVTPNDLVTAIVTNAGVAYPPYDRSLRLIATQR